MQAREHADMLCSNDQHPVRVHRPCFCCWEHAMSINCTVTLPSVRVIMALLFFRSAWQNPAWCSSCTAYIQPMHVIRHYLIQYAWHSSLDEQAGRSRPTTGRCSVRHRLAGKTESMAWSAHALFTLMSATAQGRSSASLRVACTSVLCLGP